ncbi:prepilin peptidase [Companilactobacillus suantsaicola]|uniref:Prepilin peptidase n=1 Tax=Companilactobacillus suantsaicola TaxID=2487723 RepID=A0A4Z0JLT9_9LACO|nr:prepilin peptidase [Companilactobacillus suantsaicola]
MEYLLQLLIFIFGACIISFLKVFAQDYPQINTRRSQCDYCHRILRWYEIIPILGYFIDNGKCSTCKNQINFLNPLQEFCGGLLILSSYYFNNLSYLPLILTLILLGFCDAFYGYVYPIFYLGFLPTIIWHFSGQHLLISLLVYLSLLLLSRNHLIGLGDVEIISILALVFNLELFLLIMILACLLCIGNFAVNKKRSFRFIPYLCIATGFVFVISSFLIKFQVGFFEALAS